MPLKIESGTYTVNPVPKKEKPLKKTRKKKEIKTRCSVHEDRGKAAEEKEEEEEAAVAVTKPPTSRDHHHRGHRSGVVDCESSSSRRGVVVVVGGGTGTGTTELPGLEEFIGDSCVATVTSSVPGAGLSSSKRTRPLSLAVQPLNYHRLDPDSTSDELDHHQHQHQHHLRANMTSQESIGSCSLDVDRSVSDRSENTTIDSVSERTLHSLNLSCNGEQKAENLVNGGSSETLQKSHLTPDDKEVIVSNGHRSSPEPEQLTAKKPSYLGLACSISGYSGITRYDSKLREGFRSRDSSPGTRLITRDTSPAGFKSNENLSVPIHHYPPKSQSISPLAMDRQNGFANGMKEECKIETYRETRNSMSICQGFSEVDKGVSLHTTFPDVSPIRVNSSSRRSPGIVQVMSCGQQNKSFSPNFAESSPKTSSTINISNTSFSETSILNGSNIDIENQTINTSSSSEKSFIQQRVERLYGPGALAQGFFFKRSVNKLNVTDNSFNKFSNNSDTSTDNVNTEESLKNLPVLRHLRPEFRAQLPVVNSRKPTDGSEQIIKPLRRISQSPRKTDQQPSKTCKTVHDVSVESVTESVTQHNNSIASIPDQQPAAPKVVLPVLEPSASSSNVAKQIQETEITTEEKNGNYFLKLLKQETDRLLSLAASAEAELVSGDPVALPEEAAGKLRSAAGKARLLASQKMQQFEGLCQKNIIQVPGEEFPTTNEDLAGFWDMVMLQVVQVNELFDQIEKSKKSQWKEEVCQVNVQSKRPSPLKSRRKKSIQVPKSRPLEKKPPDSVPNNTNECISKELKPSKARHFLLNNNNNNNNNSNNKNIDLELYQSTMCNDKLSDVKKELSKDDLTKSKNNIIIVERCIPEYTNRERFFFNPDSKSFYVTDQNNCVHSDNVFSNEDDNRKPNDTKINTEDKIERIFKEEFTSTQEKYIHTENTSAQTSFLSIGESTNLIETRKKNIFNFPIKKSSYRIIKPNVKSQIPIRECSKTELNRNNNNANEEEFFRLNVKHLTNDTNEDNNIIKENESQIMNSFSRSSISSNIRKQQFKKLQYSVTFSDEINSRKTNKPLFDDRENDSVFSEDILENIHNYDISDEIILNDSETNFRSKREIINRSSDDSKPIPTKSLKGNSKNTISIPQVLQKSKINLYKKLNNTRIVRKPIEKSKGIRKNDQTDLQNDNKNNNNIEIVNNEKIIKPGGTSNQKNTKHRTIESIDSNNTKIMSNKIMNRSLNKSNELTREKIEEESSSSKQFKSTIGYSRKQFSIVPDISSNADTSTVIKNNTFKSIANKNHLTKQNDKVYNRMQINKDMRKNDNDSIGKDKKGLKSRLKSPQARRNVWSPSDSQPFIPLSEETLKQLGRLYRIGKHDPILTTSLKDSSNNNNNNNIIINNKLDKIKPYDQKIKERFNKINKLLSKETIINNCQDKSTSGCIIMDKENFHQNDINILTECEYISSMYNTNVYYANGDKDKTSYIFDITKLSDKSKDLERFVSSIVTSLNNKLSNKNVSSKLLKTEIRKCNIKDNDRKDNHRNEISLKEWNCNKLIYSRSIATFSLCNNTSKDLMTKSFESFETDTTWRKNKIKNLSLKACVPMNSNISMKFLRKRNDKFNINKIQSSLISDKYFPLNRKCIEVYDIVPEKKNSNASLSQNGNTAKRRITPVHKTKPTANSEANKKAREAREQARRQLIEEKRRAMRSNMQNQDNSVKIFAPET
ncbi:hypothetical protein M0802_000291 [Mischocyttarus mexicanus]|nr:hypothetical protein M0802_000291 [Mischocyttarus mexicanus]